MIKNISLAVVALLAAGLGILAYTQYSSAEAYRKELGMAHLKLQCLEWRDQYILGIMDKDQGIQMMDACQNQLTDDEKKLIPAP